MDILRRVRLFEKRDQLAGGLTIADKKRLEFAKALATEPRLLMLDEVLAGLNPSETVDAVGLVKSVRDSGVTVLMVEHVMEAIMPISDRVVVLDSGKKIAEGRPENIIQNPDVISAYLGAKYHAKNR
jgi:branched-chain amino acid transport system ATP-binding protein